MSWREALIEILESEPSRTLLCRTGAHPSGEWLLGRLSFPRAIYPTFEEAWAAARRVAYAGHDHPDYIREHLELASGLRASDYPALYWLLATGAAELRVFDFGGNIGNLYYSYSGYLAGKLQLAEWIVFDLPQNLEEGRNFAAERKASRLHFVNTLNGFSPDHILLVSGSFHYWEGSVEEFIWQFPHPPETIIVNRTPVIEGAAAFITVQHRGSYAVPCIVRNAAEMIAEFSRMGYAMVDRWPVLELALRMPLFPERNVPHFSGFYFRKVSH